MLSLTGDSVLQREENFFSRKKSHRLRNSPSPLAEPQSPGARNEKQKALENQITYADVRNKAFFIFCSFGKIKTAA